MAVDFALFDAQLNAAQFELSGRWELFFRRLAAGLYQRILLRTPVDTGRLRGGLQLSLGTPITSQVARQAQNGGGVAVQVRAETNKLVQFQLGQTIWISNNVEYAVIIERGRVIGNDGVLRGSLQAPRGFFGVSVEEQRQELQGLAT